MKHLFLIILAALASGTVAYAQKKTFVRDYTYQASEVDSKVTARANATTQMRTTLLREIGEFLHSEITLTRNDTSEQFAQKIEAITAGIIEMKTLDEQWDGATYYIKAKMTVDPKDLERRIAEVLNDKQKTKDLEDARKRTLAAEAEAARLRKELEQTKNEQQRSALKTTYQQAADALSAEEYFTRGENARENGFYELAIEYYQKAIDLDPNDAVAYNNMGVAYHNLANYDEAIRCYREAIRCYQKAIEIDPNNAAAYNSMGRVYKNFGDYHEAILCYQKAIAIDPNHAIAYNNMGIACANLEDYHEAIRCYQKAIAIDPSIAEAYYNMGIAYKKLRDYREAIQCYKKAIAINPNLAAAYNNMGTAYDKLKKYREAIRCYKKAIAIDPNDAAAYYNMGGSYDDMENYDEAFRCYQKAARLGLYEAQELLRENGETW